MEIQILREGTSDVSRPQRRVSPLATALLASTMNLTTLLAEHAERLPAAERAELRSTVATLGRLLDAEMGR